MLRRPDLTSRAAVHVTTLDLDVLGVVDQGSRSLVEPVARAALGALSTQERERARLLRTPGSRTEFVLTRGVLRLLLGRTIGAEPRALRFALGAQGKPYLPDHPDLHFNVSHTAGRALIALTHAGPLGVDVERLDPELDCAPVADQVFSARTRHAIAAAPSERRTGLFFRCWVRGEAILKATGVGLAGAGDGFDVPAGAGDGLDVPVGTSVWKHAGLAARGVWLEDLPTDEEYAAAVAVVGGDLTEQLVVVEQPIPRCGR